MSGVTVGIGVWETMALATALGFVSGYTLGLMPLVGTGMNRAQAFRAFWIGETISLAVLELTMNFPTNMSVVCRSRRS